MSKQSHKPPIVDERTHVLAGKIRQTVTMLDETAPAATGFTDEFRRRLKGATEDLRFLVYALVGSEPADGVTLTKAEACAISCYLRYSAGDCMLDDDTRDRDVCLGLIRRLQLEAAVRDAGDWWHREEDPAMLAMYATLGKATCPDVFRFDAEGVPALAELLPIMLSECMEELADTRRGFRIRSAALIEARSAAKKTLSTALGLTPSATRWRVWRPVSALNSICRWRDGAQRGGSGAARGGRRDGRLAQATPPGLSLASSVSGCAP